VGCLPTNTERALTPPHLPTPPPPQAPSPSPTAAASESPADREFRLRVREAMGVSDHFQAVVVRPYCAAEPLEGFEGEALLLLGKAADAPVTRLQVRLGRLG